MWAHGVPINDEQDDGGEARYDLEEYCYAMAYLLHHDRNRGLIRNRSKIEDAVHEATLQLNTPAPDSHYAAVARQCDSIVTPVMRASRLGVRANVTPEGVRYELVPDG